jgi:hypothetical protein
MLSHDTREEVLQYLLKSRYAYILDLEVIDLANGVYIKSFNSMTDQEIMEEFECSYHCRSVHDELYDRMVAEMEAHRMLTPTVPNNG